MVIGSVIKPNCRVVAPDGKIEIIILGILQQQTLHVHTHRIRWIRFKNDFTQEAKFF